ncbi:MAG: hypothetical protein AMXMBFR13_17730 [Phycisphaerae bacterium]
MYCSHFGLHRPPFNNTPDPTFYFGTPEHEEALATLHYATQERKGFVLVTGEVGAGKTLIGRMFLRQIEPQAKTAVITHTHLNGRQLLAAICSELELPAVPDDNNLQLAERLQEYLLEQFSHDRHVVVLLDEAQNLPDESFEALRMLGNLEADDAKLLQVCILGQPELRERFDQPGMRQLDQRLFRRFHLPALNAQQTADYILHRLRVAGREGEGLFTPEAMKLIAETSGGIPRVINKICDNALLTAFGKELHVVEAGLIEQVLERAAVPVHAAEPGVPGVVAAEAARPDDSVERRLEEIYGAAPELLESTAGGGGRRLMVDLPPDRACMSEGEAAHCSHVDAIARNRRKMQTMARGTARRWRDARKRLEVFRDEIHAVINDVATRCQATQTRLDEFARNMAPAEELEEIRQMHLRETQRVLGEIGRQREEFHQLLQQADARWEQMSGRIAEVTERSASTDRLAQIEGAHQQRIEELLAQVEDLGARILATGEEVRRRADQTERECEALRQSQSQAAAEALERFTRTFSAHEQQVRALAGELSDRIASVGRTVDQLRENAATDEDLQRARREHAAALAELAGKVSRESEALLQLRQELNQRTGGFSEETKFQTTRLNAQISGWQRRLEVLGREVKEQQTALSARVDALAGRLDEREAYLQGLAQQLQEQAGHVESLNSLFSGRLAKLDESVTALCSRSVGREELEQARANAAGVLEDLARRLDEQAGALQRFEAAIQQRAGDISAETRILLDEHTIRVGGLAEELQQLRDAWVESHRQIEQRLADAGIQLTEHQDRLEGLNARLQQHLAQIDAHLSALHESTANRAELENLRAESAELMAALTGRLEACEQRVGACTEQADQRFTGLNRVIQILRDGAATQDDLVRVRSEHTAAVQELSDRLLAEAAELGRLREQIETRASDADERQRLAINALSRRVEQQTTRIDDLTGALAASQECLTSQIEEMTRGLATRQEMEVLRETTESRHNDVLERIQTSRAALEQLIELVIQRCRSTQARLEQLAATQVDAGAFAEFRDRQQESVGALLDRLEEHKQAVGAQFEGMLDRWQRAQAEMERLRGTSATQEQLNEVRSRQARDREALLAAMGAQRQDLERLLDAVTRRCGELTRRIDAMPADPVGAEQLAVIREELTGELRMACERIDAGRTEFGQALGELARRCDETQAQLTSLASRAASNRDVQELRRLHEQRISGLLHRMNCASSEHQQEVADLNRRWEDLTGQLQALASSTTPAETFAAAERNIAQELAILRHRLDDVGVRQDEQLRVLMATVRQLTSRVTGLEEAERPVPVRMELTPEAAERLAGLTDAARAEQERLAASLTAVECSRNDLTELSRRVEEGLGHWREQAACVDAQSQRLRASAGTAGELLKVMQRVHATLESKINSQRWCEELSRGEALAGRLEGTVREGRTVCGQLLAALRDYERCREEAESWSSRHEQARQLTDRLARLLAESQRTGAQLDGVVEGRKRVLETLARNTARMADVIESARRAETAPATTGARRPPATDERVSRIDWPRIETEADRLAARVR